MWISVIDFFSNRVAKYMAGSHVKMTWGVGNQENGVRPDAIHAAGHTVSGSPGE